MRQSYCLKHLIFDLDGTLYPRESTLYLALAAGIRRFILDRIGFGDNRDDAHFQEIKQKYPSPLLLAKDMGWDYGEFQREVFSSLNAEAHLGRNDALARGLLRFPGEKFIVTLSSTPHARAVLKALGIEDHFSSIITPGPDWCTTRKLDAYETIRNFMKARPWEVGIIGDDPGVDLLDAHAHGYPCIAVGSQGPCLPGLVTLERIEDLEGFLARESSDG